MCWPPIPSSAAASILAIQFLLEQSQWLSPALHWRRQWQQLASLVAHARTTVPYYSEIPVDLSDRERVEYEEWLSLPVLTRSQLQSENERLHSNEVPTSHGKVRPQASSGSTGRPVSVLWSDVSRYFYHAAAQRDHHWHCHDVSGKLASIRHIKFDTQGIDSSSPRGLSLPDWGPPLSVSTQTGPAVVLSVHRPVNEQVKWLLREDPDYLQTYPSNLLQLASHCLKHGITFSRLKAVRTVSEVLTPEVRHACSEAFGVACEDVYTTTETGYIALQCPEHEHYHVQSEIALVEVLGADGRPCVPGETGRVVVTPLHHYAMPLLRYEIGDYAEVGEPCPCGRGLPVLNRILGRARNLLVFPDGTTDWPVFRDTRFRSIAPVSQFQFVQKSLHRIEARLVVERALSQGEEHALRELILERLRYRFDLIFKYVDSIPRGPGGKYEDFRSEVSQNS